MLGNQLAICMFFFSKNPNFFIPFFMAKLMQTKQLIAVLIFSSLCIQLFMLLPTSNKVFSFLKCYFTIQHMLFVVSSFLQIGHIISLSFFVKFFMVDVVSAATKKNKQKKQSLCKLKITGSALSVISNNVEMYQIQKFSFLSYIFCFNRFIQTTLNAQYLLSMIAHYIIQTFSTGTSTCSFSNFSLLVFKRSGNMPNVINF